MQLSTLPPHCSLASPYPPRSLAQFRDSAGSSTPLSFCRIYGRAPRIPLSKAHKRFSCAVHSRARRGQASAAGSDPVSRDGAGSAAAVAERDATGSGAAVKKVVVLGGSGRVGRSTAAALLALTNPTVDGDSDPRGNLVAPFSLDIVIAGRNSQRGQEVAGELEQQGVKGRGEGAGRQASVSFVECDINDANALQHLLSGADLVVHTAGPFQRAPECTVLQAAIRARTPYIDVCDDVEYAMAARRHHAAAVAAGVPAIVTTGIYPGVSNLMGAELVRLAGEEEAGKKAEAGGQGEGEEEAEGGSSSSSRASGLAPSSLRYAYFTAGSGGAGPTILATSFLLLGEPVQAFQAGKAVQLRAYSRPKLIDFGPGIGERMTYLLNLPEVASAHEVLGVPTVLARFGTSPPVWNWGMQAMQALLPPSVLRDGKAVQHLVRLTEPLVRAVDYLTGQAVAMRVDLETANGRTTTAVFSHKHLSVSVGQATAAFALAVLEGCTQPGVWFPEQPEAIPVGQRQKLFQRAAVGARFFAINKPPWMIEREPKRLGMGIYL